MDRRTAALLAALLALPAAGRPAGGQTPPRAAGMPTLAAPNPAYVEALRPILARGGAILPYGVDDGANARSTILLRVAAPLATVHRVISAPEHYPAFMPAVSNVEILSRRGRRAAFRFHVGMGVFDVTADAMLHAVGDRRIDVVIPRSDFGPSVSRWDLYPDGSSATLVALTTWADPSQGNWAVRQAAGQSPWAPSGAAITAATVLALGVKRRAEVLQGARLPVRPARASVRPTALEPPPPGPWLEIAQTVNVMVMTLDASGALAQITAVGATSVSPASVAARLADVEHYGEVWGWLHNGTVLARPSPRSVRFRLATSAPLAAQQGEYVRTVAPDGLGVRLDGVAGAFAGESIRWDIVPHAGGCYVLLTGGSEAAHVGWVHRALMDRDPWVVPGLSAYWKVVALRYGLAGLR